MRRLTVKSETFRIEVRRDYVLADAIKEARKTKFDVQKTIKVHCLIYIFARL